MDDILKIDEDIGEPLKLQLSEPHTHYNIELKINKNQIDMDINPKPKIHKHKITKTECPANIKFLGYGVHYGPDFKFRNFMFWKLIKILPKLDKAQISFEFDIPKNNYVMIEVMGYSKMEESTNIIQYYIEMQLEKDL